MDNPALDLQNERESQSPGKRRDAKMETDLLSATNQNGHIIDSSPRPKEKGLYYKINDVPPWYLSIVLGFQHYLTMAGSTIAVPFILTPKMCMTDDDPDRANIICTLIFVSGIITLFQSIVGTRLPIVQGASFGFVVPALAILALPKWECPSQETMDGLTREEKTEIWQLRMRELQGAIICASIFEILFGALGIVGVILKFVTPLTIAPAIAMIGIALFREAGKTAASNWAISGLTIFLIIIFSQYLKSWKVPVPFTKSDKRAGVKRYPLFEVFPVLLTMAIVWTLSAVLTAVDFFPAGNPARTDIKTNIITQSPWFRIPYPLQWGLPTVTVGSVFGMLSAVITGSIESIGDYYAAARISGAPNPPKHAINRGIFVEGLGCLFAGFWGTGNGTTSYSENIGTMSITNVGSRRVIQMAALLMIIFALIGKVGAIFISIPQPIVGGVFCIVFAMVTAVGLSNLQSVDLNSPRNIFILGFSLFFSLTISQWMEANPGAINVGVDSIDQIITILMSTGMFVAMSLGFILDNTIPGTNQERGIREKNEDQDKDDTSTVAVCYDLPYGMNLFRKIKILHYLPISPTYSPNENKRTTNGRPTNQNHVV